MASTMEHRDLIVFRSAANGLKYFDGPPSFKEIDTFLPDMKTSKVMKFSDDGQYFAWGNGMKVIIQNCDDGTVHQEIEKPGIRLIAFSPKSTYIHLWHQYAVVPGNEQGTPNLSIYNVIDGKCAKAFIQRKHQNWCPQWTMDEKICARIVSNEVHIFENGNFDTISHKMHVQKIQDFSLSPTEPYHFAAYVPSAKSAPASVRVYKFPHLTGAPITSRSFYKCDRITFAWNNTGTALAVQAETDADKSNTSYYGESQVFLLTVAGDAIQLPLAQKKKGPIYTMQWHPESNMFCVVFGFVPPRATLFSKKGEELFDFPESYKNNAIFNPFGNLIAFSGFGNMQGGCEIWDVEKKRLISTPVMKDTTNLEWHPDGIHLISSTVTPRLRVANGYRVWHYTGTLLHEDIYDVNTEIYEVTARPARKGVYCKPEISYKAVQGLAQQPAKKASAAYRPPHARSSNVVDGVYKPAGRTPVGVSNTGAQSGKPAQNKPKDNILSKPDQQVPAAQDIQKRTRNIAKKLEQIAVLKQKKAAGEQLEKNQVEKINTEKTLLEELASLKV